MLDTVRVWIIPAKVTPDELARCRAVLDPDERARAATLTDASIRDRFTVAHGALRILVGRVLDAPPERLAWARGRHGKPALTGPGAGLHTNLSHSGNLIAVAVNGDRPVGVDIQHLVPGRDAVAMSARFFHPEEARHVAAGRDAGARAERFARLWARKEAVVKAAGGRLWPNLRMPVHRCDVVECVEPLGPHRLTDIVAPAAFRAAVALARDAPYVVESFDGFAAGSADGPNPHL